MSQRPSKPARNSKSQVLGQKTFAAITAVEGLRLSANSNKRVKTLLSSKLSPEARRAEVLRAYMETKGRK